MPRSRQGLRFADHDARSHRPQVENAANTRCSDGWFARPSLRNPLHKQLTRLFTATHFGHAFLGSPAICTEHRRGRQRANGHGCRVRGPNPRRQRILRWLPSGTRSSGRPDSLRRMSDQRLFTVTLRQCATFTANHSACRRGCSVQKLNQLY